MQCKESEEREIPQSQILFSVCFKFSCLDGVNLLCFHLQNRVIDWPVVFTYIYIYIYIYICYIRYKQSVSASSSFCVIWLSQYRQQLLQILSRTDTLIEILVLTSVTGTDCTLESTSYWGTVPQYLHAALATVATVPIENNTRQIWGLVFCVIPAVEYRKQLSCSYVCVCVCVYICMYVYVCMYICMHVCTYVCMYVCVYVCMYVCMYVCTYVCMYVRMCVCMNVCMYVYVCMYVCMHMCICMCVCMYVCMHACVYVCMYVLCMYVYMYVCMCVCVCM